MEDVVKIRYLYGDSNDLVCDLTEFMDNYVTSKSIQYCHTYIYNDLTTFSTDTLLKLVFRYPGATRGCIFLNRLDSHKFKIIGFGFNVDECFGNKIGCYSGELRDAIDVWVGKILDFSEVNLIGNYSESTYI